MTEQQPSKISQVEVVGAFKNAFDGDEELARQAMLARATDYVPDEAHDDKQALADLQRNDPEGFGRILTQLVSEEPEILNSWLAGARESYQQVMNESESG